MSGWYRVSPAVVAERTAFEREGAEVLRELSAPRSWWRWVLMSLGFGGDR